jgi:hypothetical protein
MYILRRWASKLFLEVRKSQFRKFLGSFRYRKSASFLGVPVRKIQIRKFLHNTGLLCLKTVLKVVSLNDILLFTSLIQSIIC